MADDFGGGLDFGGDFGGGGDALPNEASYTEGQGPLDLTPSAGAGGGGAAVTAEASPSNPLANLFGRKSEAFANRPQLDTQNPVQDRINAATAARARLQRSIDNPIRAFLKPEAWQRDLQAAGQLDQQLLQAKQAIQTQQDLRQGAALGGLDPERINRLGATATDQTVLNEWTGQLNTGSFTAAQHFMGLGEQGQKILAQQEGVYMPALADRNDQAKGIVQRLNNAAQNGGEPAYKAELNAMGGPQAVTKALANYVPGFTVPDKPEAWMVRSQGVQGALSKADSLVKQYQQRTQQIGMSTPITDEKVASAHLGTSFKGTYGDALPGASAITTPSGEVAAKLAPGSNDPEKNYARPGGYTNESKENVKEFNTRMATDQTKGAVESFKIKNDFYKTVNDPKMLTTAAGVALVNDKLGAVGRDVSEKSTAAGSIGLSKMLESKYGTVGGWLNTAQREWSEFKQAVDKGEKNPEARLSKNTVQGIKDIAEFERKTAGAEAAERLGGVMHYAGYNGIDPSHTALGKDLQAMPELKSAWEAGRHDYVSDVFKHPFTTEGTSRVLYREDSKSGVRAEPLKKADDAHDNEHAAPAAVNAARARIGAGPGGNGVDHAQTIVNAATLNIESGNGKVPDAPGSKYRGLAQMSPAEMQRYGVKDPNDRGQVNMALALKARDDGQTLQKAGIENTPANRYLVHQQGAAGAPALLKNPDMPAWEAIRSYYGSEAVAKKAIWGNLPDSAKKQFGSVENVKAGDFTGWWTDRYNRELAKVAGKVYGAAADASTNMIPGVAAAKALWSALPESARTKIKDTAVEHAPAIASTAGAIAGGGAGAAAGPAGAVAGGVAGGAAGGAAGQAFKNWMQGRDVSEGVPKQAALGGVFGVVPEARPVLGTMARIAGAGTVEGVDKALDPEAENSDAILAAAKGAGLAAVGEAGGQVLGRIGEALGMAGHKIWSRFHGDAQQELAKAGEVIAKGKPEAPAPTAAGPVPATVKAEHKAATEAYDEAVQKAKDAGIDPEHLAYAVKQVGAGATKGEAVVERPLEMRKQQLGQEFQDVSKKVGETGVGKVKAQPTLPDGPTSLVRTKDNPAGVVPEKYAKAAQDAEIRVTAPAANFQDKWDQLHKVQSDLLAKERDAIQSTAPDKTERAEAMRALAESVHKQQEKIANYVFGPKAAPAIMAQYRQARAEYAKLMQLENGKGLIEAAAKTDKQGREVTQQYMTIAANDPLAQAMFKRLVSAERSGKGTADKVIVPLAVLGHLVPGAGHVAAALTVGKAQRLVREVLIERGAGKPVQMKDLLPKYGVKLPKQQMGATGARALVQ
jgi:hypothetical protein